jgi:hypothetical protein
MIDFRYHLVSIIAVFLALAVGIVLGSGPLKGTIDQALTSRYEQLQKDKETLRDENAALQRENDYYEQAGEQTEPGLVVGQLTGRSAALVVLPGADGKLADEVTEIIESAGAKVSGRVTVTDDYLDPEKGAELDNLVTRLAPSGLTFPADATASVRAASVLASAIVTKDPLQANQADEPSAAVLAGLSELGFVTVNGDPSKRAPLAVVVAPPAPQTPSDTTAHDNAAMLDLVGALDARDNGSVVGGPVGSATDGGLVSALRDAGRLAAAVSSVDSADTSPGREAVVFSLLDEIAGKSGHYGFGPGADSAMPKLTSASTQ